MTIHVELLPGLITFCGLAPDKIPLEDSVVSARDWSREVEQVQHADCTGCLMKLFMLGDSARLKLGRMGMRVDVHDVDEDALKEN